MLRSLGTARAFLRGVGSRSSYSSPSSSLTTTQQHHHDAPTFIPHDSIPVSVPFPDVPEVTFAPFDPIKLTQTVLANGITVVSHNTPGQATNISLWVRAGSRYETAQTSGAAHFLSGSAWKSSEIKSYARIYREAEQIGASLNNAIQRETVCFTVDVLKHMAPYALRILREGALNNKFDALELEETRNQVLATVKDQATEHLVQQDALHSVAYNHATLGNPLLGTPRSLRAHTAETLRQFRDQYFIGKNFFICGAGVEHKDLVKCVENEFGDVPAGNLPLVAPAAYVGGDYRHHSDEVDSTHIAIALHAPSWNDADMVPVNVLLMLMGGGANFSEGGPGKGITSRLYREILSKYDEVHTVYAFNHMYQDSSLFGITGSVGDSHHAAELANIIAGQLKNIANVAAEDVSRAKNQLVAQIHMSLESRILLNEDTGRQMAMSPAYRSAKELCTLIAKVTPADVARVGKRMLSSAPSVSVIGAASKVPRYEQLARVMGAKL
eukprot:gnl/Hemi2/9643_TR3350_c0_g1_i1.p1 gnl/Hemi2/9643_TR3350_c0_g1~~gnl/Hemi2/9643_TR3350_c0_g1_i1.p1  ORF type:complete len:497 (+),score=115.54 gnl/Hemi2/9643_TR3350_c0_g1_i1:87-1577(+)